jgi:uncharacterized membrane protein
VTTEAPNSSKKDDVMQSKSTSLATCVTVGAILTLIAGTILATMDAIETAKVMKDAGTQAGRGSEYNFAGAIAINSVIAGIFIMPAAALVGGIGSLIRTKPSEDNRQ